MDKKLHITAQITNSGLTIELLKKKYQTVYPKKIWQKTTPIFKIALLENFVFGICEVVPVILNKVKTVVNFKRPILENLFFRNQLYDITDCEKGDNKPPLHYLKKFYNLDWQFASGNSTIPQSKDTTKNTNHKTAIVPFTFGKESLVTAGLCRELGIKPILVYCEEPAQMY